MIMRRSSSRISASSVNSSDSPSPLTTSRTFSFPSSSLTLPTAHPTSAMGMAPISFAAAQSSSKESTAGSSSARAALTSARPDLARYPACVSRAELTAISEVRLTPDQVARTAVVRRKTATRASIMAMPVSSLPLVTISRTNYSANLLWEIGQEEVTFLPPPF